MRLFVQRFVLALLAAVSLSAASIQIIVRADNGRIKESVTITVNPANGTGNEALLAIKAWRDAQLDNNEPPQALFPNTRAGHLAFWKTVIIPPLRVKARQFPWASLAAKIAISESTATADTNAELRSAFN